MSLHDIRKRTAEKLSQPTGGHNETECRECRSATAQGAYGGLCGGCYGRYCNSATPAQTVTEKERLAALIKLRKAFVDGAPNVAWAEALKKREKEGDRLTQAQREMWRAALKAGAHEDTPETLLDVRDRQIDMARRVEEYKAAQA